MAIEALSSSRVLNPEYKLRLVNRVYPTDLREAHETPEGGSLGEQLSEKLWRPLPFVQHPEHGFRDLEQLIDSYVASMRALEFARQEASRFLRSVCQANFEFRAEGVVSERQRVAVLREEHSRRDAILTVPSLGVDTVLTADIAKDPLPVAERKLRQSLRERSAAFVQSLFETLDRCVDREVLGLIDWKTEDACVFYFFRRVVIQRTTGTRTVVEEKERVQVSALRTRVTDSVTEITSGEHEFRSARVEHHLILAGRTALAETKAAIPQPTQQLIEEMPAWLRPFVEVVDGKRIRERIVEREIDRRSWEERRELEDVVRVVSIPDPALVLGQYVITGWGEREIKAERERQEAVALESEVAEKERSLQAEFRKTVLFAPLVLLVGLLLFGPGSVFSPVLFWVGMAVCLGSLVPAVWALVLDAERTYHPSPGKYLAWGSLSLVAAVLGLEFLTFAAVARSLPAVGAGALLFLLLWLCARRALRHREGSDFL